MNVSTSRQRTRKALADGILFKSHVCEVCGKNPKEQRSLWHCEPGPRRENLVAHHWKGYDYPMDVWWVCYSCNSFLHGKHDGSLETPKDALLYIHKGFVGHKEDEPKDWLEVFLDNFYCGKA